MLFRSEKVALLPLFLSNLIHASQWPYTRRFTNSTLPVDEHDDEMPNLFIDWMRGTLHHDTSGQLKQVFINGEIPKGVKTFEELEKYALHHIENHTDPLPPVVWDAIPGDSSLTVAQEAAALFNHLNFQLDPACLNDKMQFWYRQENGHCNWLKKDQAYIGVTGYPRSRDWDQTTYADGISVPREGPNPREVSNAFFKRKQRLHYEHTPIMLGLVEFIMHDVTYSADSSTEFIDVPIPKGDPAYDPHSYGNASLRVWRTKPLPGTGTDRSNPRQHTNEATAWMDVSPLYGSTAELAHILRSHVNGKLRSQRGKDGLEYLPFNKEGLPVRTRPGIDPHSLFLGGDVRTNEDWIMLSVHTLFLREHNRLCDIIVSLHPDWNDERIYQTVKLIVGAKLALIGNSYQMAYWTDKMPWPRDDGFPLYRAIYGESVLQINPAHTYPWPMVTRNDRPMVASAEMSIVYRFHEFIINNFPIKDEHNHTIQEKDLFSTAFDSPTYFDIGTDPILRGMLASDIPNFKSGVDEEFRSAGKYRGAPFDIVTWSVVHEREQGLPTFNQYYRGYNSQTPPPALPVKIRETFEDFSSDPEMVAHLKRLYKTPDDVDFVVGVQLEEELFPGTTMPKSALIPSLLSLFGVGNSDRFSPGFAVMRCILVDKPWNCKPSNALEELIWKPKPTKHHPNARWFDPFWMTELDFQAHGVNLLWRLITENSNVKCIQKNPLFPFDPHTNPVLCELEPHKSSITWWKVTLGTTAAIAIGYFIVSLANKPRYIPPTNWGKFIVGCGQDLQKDPKGFLVSQAKKYGYQNTFGVRLFGSLVYYIASGPVDIAVMMNDELRASAHALTKDSQLGAVVGRRNFAQDLHASVIRRKLETEALLTLPSLANVVSHAVDDWLEKNPLKDSSDISKPLLNLMAHVMSRVCVGSQGFDDPELIDAFIGLNTDSGVIFQVSNLLPGFIARIFSDIKVRKHYGIIKKKILPVIKERRKKQIRATVDETAQDLLGFFLDVTDSDESVAELVGGICIGGLINVSTGVTNGLYDIAGVKGLQDHLRTISPPDHFVATKASDSHWDKLRSAVLESLRLSACVFGPVRKIIVHDFKLGSNPKLQLPKGSGFAVSPYLVHYDDKVYPKASQYEPERFRGDVHDNAQIDTPKYLTFGLPPHTCPGRFFAVQTVSIALNALLNRYEFELPMQPSTGEDKYTYLVGVVVMSRKPLPIKVVRRIGASSLVSKLSRAISEI